MRQALLAILLLGACFALPAAASPRTFSATVVGLNAGGVDLPGLDTNTERYTQLDHGVVRLRLYISPVGAPDAAGWHQRQLQVREDRARGTLVAARVPFALALATRAGGPSLATLTNEDGVTLGVGLPTTRPATAQVGTSAITYTGVVSPTPAGAPTATARPSATATAQPTAGAAPRGPSATPRPPTPTATPARAPDLSLAPTLSGLDVRIILHSAHDRGPFTVTLAPDPRAGLVSGVAGSVLVRRALVGKGDDGITPYVTDQTEYVVQAPVARDRGAGAALPMSSNPVTMTVVRPAGSVPRLVLGVRTSWLRDPRRSFPVRLDLPIITAYAAAHGGLFGTVTGCAPDAPAPPTDVLVGTVGTCAYRARLRFDLSSILADTPVISATLRLYTPRTTGPSGVAAYPEAPAPDALADGPPTWATTPPVAGAALRALPVGRADHWQSWDVTGLVRRWVGDPATNAGLTLVRSGAPVVFASTLGATQDDPGQAPYLDVALAPRPAVTPAFDDHAASIYGVAGAFVTDRYVGSGIFPCPPRQPACPPGGAIRIGTVAAPQPHGLGGSYVRVSVALSCRNARPGYAWWNRDNRPNNVPIYDIVKAAYAAHPRLIPIVNLVADDVCLRTRGPLTNPSWWESEAADVVAHLSDPHVKLPVPLPGPIYFEIGNEVNIHPAYTLYPRLFAAAAQGLYRALTARDRRARVKTAYRILTAGMLYPSTRSRIYCDQRADPNHDNIRIAQAAIGLAERSAHVPVARLGVGLHPYTYDTPDHHGYWLNYYGTYHNEYTGLCRDLRDMIARWTATFPRLPLVFTEDNWGSTVSPHCRNPRGVTTDRLANCSGAYLVDLFTWLHRHGYDAPRHSPIRIAWFRGADSGDALLGIYGGRGQEKPVTIAHCPARAVAPYVAGRHPLSSAYYWLRRAGCYEPGGL